MAYKKLKIPDPDLKTHIPSILGKDWVFIFEYDVDFNKQHFEIAMSNIVKQPNINSTVIIRADILIENQYDENKGDTMFKSKLINDFPKEDGLLYRDISDLEIRKPNIDMDLKLKIEIVRRIIPRNPFKDFIINQTCIILSGDNSLLVIYSPHINHQDETPYYLPPVKSIGILYHKSKISIHYLPYIREELVNMASSERPIRIALRLLQTSIKHSKGVKDGYEKRVIHDLVVPKIEFQNRYISLKQKYSVDLVNNWVEKTPATKHVFEDLAIAAFLIEYWIIKGFKKEEFEFRDLGCGNGLLVYILIMEGYKGKGIDARERKSWSIYPKEVRDNLLEQIIVPEVILQPHPALGVNITREFKNGDNILTSNELLNSPDVCTSFQKNTFIIGNHSDELTCWIPLFGHPFLVIPCCSHALNGDKVRYPPINRKNVSTYGSLVDHVEKIAQMTGWLVEKEMLRIPSTRNAAIMSNKNILKESEDISTTRKLDIIALEGGAEKWVENSLKLRSSNPRNH
ncbi:unnamed protein product [Candida verbasci]|uniref:tRNA (uracil-O(2)-)-methyltransferase n=1 Tax=Candida verbasci TaxID=1227364 RepID=A0A9W4TWA8_9ASCO|nr:unnamed protein product [Candida verbasci]